MLSCVLGGFRQFCGLNGETANVKGFANFENYLRTVAAGNLLQIAFMSPEFRTFTFAVSRKYSLLNYDIFTFP